jgi:hypothetical protein
MELRALCNELGLPYPVELPDDVIEGPFDFNFTTELDYDEGSENVGDLLFTAAAATCGSDLRFRQLASTGATPDVSMLVVGGLVELYDLLMYQTATPEGLQKELNSMYLYRALPGSRSTDRFPLGSYAGVPAGTQSHSIVDSDLATTTYGHKLREAVPFMLPNPWIVDFKLDTFAIAYAGGSGLAGDTPVRASLYGVAWKNDGTIVSPRKHGLCVVNDKDLGNVRDREIKRRGMAQLHKRR